MKNKFLFTVLSSFIFLNSFSQINIGGSPYSFSDNGLKSQINFEKMPFVDVAKLIEQDKKEDLRKDKPWRFGENIDVEIDIKKDGTPDDLKNGGKIWRYGIESKDALSINLMFGKYKLPRGATLYIYNENKSHIIGGFTDFNNQDDGVFATTLIKGDKIIIEYFEPKNCEFSGELILNRVTHGYRGISDYRKSFGSSGSCNMNVACPDGDIWSDEIRSVAMMVTGGSGFCTGALVNNTSEDGTPYFLTANHCYSDPSAWVFWFNWQSETCDNPSVSPSHDDMSGAVIRAKNSDSDFCLVELLSTPPMEYEVYYAGWNRSVSPPTSQVGIHHPSGDIKKISFDDDPAVSSDYDPSPYLADSHWEVSQWDRNTTTEPGSSGSPLFDQNHRIIGQLHGGYASCTNFTADYYGKFSMSWDRGGTPETRLEDWLDPQNTGTTTLDGYDTFIPSVSLDARILRISIPENTYTTEQNIAPTVTIQNKGANQLTSATVKYKIDEEDYVIENWNGLLDYNETAEIIFPETLITYGNHTFETLVTAPNGSSDENTENDTLIINVSVNQIIFQDDFESNLGWTLNSEWERGSPQGLGGDQPYSDPSSAYSGTNVLGLDLSGQGIYAGDYENNLSDREEFAISPVFDCSQFENIKLLFQRWLGVEEPIYDHAYIDISTNGGTDWTEVWTNTTTISESTWSTQEIDISSYADGEANVQIKFSIGATDDSWQYCGWNIDDFAIIGLENPALSNETLNPYNNHNNEPYLIYPNPSEGIINVVFRDKIKDVNVEILDISGKLIYNNFFSESNEFKIQIDAIPGIYFLKILTKGKVITKKLILK